MSYQPDADAIRKRVVKRIRKRLFWAMYLMMGAPMMCWAANVSHIDGWRGAGAIVALWFFGLIVLGLKTTYDWMVERGIQHESERERLLFESVPKQKNDAQSAPRLRLGDDGELIDPDFDSVDEGDSQKLKRGA